MGTLLIVDEDADTREAYGALLTAPDRTVVTAENPEQALETARALHPSLILLDLRTPGIDGSDFLRRKRDVPAIAAIPTIVISATATELPEHASDLLGKPFNPTTLIALVGQYSNSFCNDRTCGVYRKQRLTPYMAECPNCGATILWHMG